MPVFGENFRENCEYNSALSAKNAKPEVYNIKRWYLRMRTEEVLDELKKHGMTISLKTLQRYQKAGLIPSPNIISQGRGKGKFADRPSRTPARAAAASAMLNGSLKALPGAKFSVKAVVEAKERAAEWSEIIDRITEVAVPPEVHNEIISGLQCEKGTATHLWLSEIVRYYTEDGKKMPDHVPDDDDFEPVFELWRRIIETP